MITAVYQLALHVQEKAIDHVNNVDQLLFQFVANFSKGIPSIKQTFKYSFALIMFDFGIIHIMIFLESSVRATLASITSRTLSVMAAASV